MKSLICIVVLAVGCVCMLATDSISGDEPKNAAIDQLLLLKVERLKVASEYGEGHPQAKMLDKQIELIETQLLAQPQPAEGEIDNADLRKIVDGLVKRVRTLENEVAKLKAREAKVELLRE